jgi:hypothetical protein
VRGHGRIVGAPEGPPVAAPPCPVNVAFPLPDHNLTDEIGGGAGGPRVTINPRAVVAGALGGAVRRKTTGGHSSGIPL